MFLSSKILIHIYAILVMALLISACKERSEIMSSYVATPDHPATAPSGRCVLEVIRIDSNRPNLLTFQILNQNKKVIYRAPERFDERHTTFFLWDNDDRVWVYSGDIGTFFWEQDVATGEWKKYVYSQSNVEAPPFLKEIRPRWHKQ